MLFNYSFFIAVNFGEQFLNLCIFCCYGRLVSRRILFHLNHADFELVALRVKVVHLLSYTSLETHVVRERLERSFRRGSFTKLNVCPFNQALDVFS